MRAPVILLVGVSVCCALLSGCKTPGAVSASPSPSSSSESGAPTDAAVDQVAIPTDCTKTMSADMYSTTFADVPLNDPVFGETGVIDPEPPSGEGTDVQQAVLSQVSLRCIWRDPNADITGLQLSVARVAPETSAAYLAVLPANGYTCESRYDGDWCQRISTEKEHGTEVGSTKFVRDDLYLEIEQTNFPTSGLLKDVVETIWAD